MKLGKVFLTAAAASLAISPALATPTANPAASLSVVKGARAGSGSAHLSDLRGRGHSGLIIGGIALVLVIVLVVVIASDKKSKSP